MHYYSVSLGNSGSLAVAALVFSLLSFTLSISVVLLVVLHVVLELRKRDDDGTAHKYNVQEIDKVY